MKVGDQVCVKDTCMTKDHKGKEGVIHSDYGHPNQQVWHVRMYAGGRLAFFEDNLEPIELPKDIEGFE